MKQWMACFCILLFSLQVMLIKEIGAILMKGRVTAKETYCSGNAPEDGPSRLIKHTVDPIREPDQSDARLRFLTTLIRLTLEPASFRSHHFTSDILTPQPDHLRVPAPAFFAEWPSGSSVCLSIY